MLILTLACHTNDGPPASAKERRRQRGTRERDILSVGLGPRDRGCMLDGSWWLEGGAVRMREARTAWRSLAGDEGDNNLEVGVSVRARDVRRRDARPTDNNHRNGHDNTMPPHIRKKYGACWTQRRAVNAYG